MQFIYCKYNMRLFFPDDELKEETESFKNSFSSRNLSKLA